MTGSRATSRTLDAPASDIDCIGVYYPGCTFLINRDQIEGSMYSSGADASRTAEGAVRLISLGERTLPVVNLDSFVRRFFHVDIGRPPEMIMLARADSPDAPRLPRIKRKSSDEVIGTDLIAVQLSARTGLMRLPLRQLRLLPSGLFPSLSGRGILGVRFPSRIMSDGLIEYLIDIQTLIATNFPLARHVKVNDENSDR